MNVSGMLNEHVLEFRVAKWILSYAQKKNEDTNTR